MIVIVGKHAKPLNEYMRDILIVTDDANCDLSPNLRQ
jgi:hypothetical protein